MVERIKARLEGNVARITPVRVTSETRGVGVSDTRGQRASEPRAEALRSVRVPTLVIHGDKDTLIDQLGGRRVAELVPGAKFALIEGMGHDYPPQLWDAWVALVVGHIESV